MFGLVLLLGSMPVFAQIPVNPGGGSGGGATIPSTTNLISGNGTGNGADSGIAPSSVATLSGTQTFSGAKTFSAGATVTSTTGNTLVVTDNEPAAGAMTGITLLAPNMVNNDVFYFIIGQANTSANSYNIRYTKVATGNYLAFSPTGIIPQLEMFSSGGTTIGNATSDSGYKLDVLGSFRAQQIAGGGTAPTIAAGAGAGTSPTSVGVTGTASAFTASLTTGTASSTSAVIATVTFPTAYTSAPHVVCQAKNAASAAATTTFFVTTTTTTAVLNAGATALTDTTLYSWDCLTVQ